MRGHRSQDSVYGKILALCAVFIMALALGAGCRDTAKNRADAPGAGSRGQLKPGARASSGADGKVESKPGERTKDMVMDKMEAGENDQFSSSPMIEPEPGHGLKPPNQDPYRDNFFESYGVNPFIAAEDEAFSTFGMDVDTAAYTVARRYIMGGNLPDKDSVRTEEFINYFKQSYPQSSGPFTIDVAGATSEFGNPNYHLLRIGVKANEVSLDRRKPANMVFVVDVSGSMDMENRLGLVKRSLRKLADHIKEGDRVGLVVYGSQGRVISELTGDKKKILAAVDELVPEGSTNAEEGITLAYDMMRRSMEPGKINRIILCSDGVANIGNTGADVILKQVKSDADKGITLTALGFGMGNYNDVLMEKLADHGDGNYYYIDTDAEAARLFGGGAVSMLQVAGSDAKIQVEFNPKTVDRYRLLGYENRRLEKEDFEDDSVDAGEVGAGQTVTALYELRIKDTALADSSNVNIATVRIRYRDIDTKKIVTNEKAVPLRDVSVPFEQASPRLRFTAAVAEFAELLKESYWAKDGSYDAMLAVARSAVRDMESAAGADEKEFIELAQAARGIWARNTDD
jgi:Ca-activated chloride channel family protein